ncbi:MAG: hypothetical protein M1834_004512 [Cirrosporium novae-zelandiae]|nr:MAG: hypothetical protein M1834_004512 [Cirrosporium novae-zelandiae]
MATEKKRKAPVEVSRTIKKAKVVKSSSVPAKPLKSALKKPKAVPEPEPVEEQEIEAEEILIAEGSGNESDSSIDEQTIALLKGFDSDEDKDGEDAPSDQGFEQGQDIPEIPDAKKLRKQLKKRGEPGKDEPGVVYVGRIPHGFYEREMRAYFNQYGDITRLRLSRNRKTGQSKHFAFIEFASAEVAKIVAQAMDNYLMFGHILKCKYVPKENIHSNLWAGANRRFKKIPWNRLEGKKLQMGKTRDGWRKKVNEETKRRKSKLEKLKAIGYEFEAPALKSVDEVPIYAKPKALPESTPGSALELAPEPVSEPASEPAPEPAPELASKTEAIVEIEEKPKKKKAKKGKKGQL